MKCPNCGEDELIPVQVVQREMPQGVVFEGDFCPSCCLLQEPSEEEG